MARFAKVENGVVTNVVIVDDEHQQYGEKYLNDMGLDGTWVDSSFDTSVGVKSAGVGDVYNEELNRFEVARPFASWDWDEESQDYLPPVPRPKVFSLWNEETLSWEEAATNKTA
jgi:hypothetical protein